MTLRWTAVVLLFASTALGASDSNEPASAVTIPIIGDTSGARAVYYSTIFVENHLEREQRDAVHNLLGLVPTNAIGAERLVAVTPTGADDPEGLISARATIVAVPRDGAGTYHQEISQVRAAELRGTGEELGFFRSSRSPHRRDRLRRSPLPASTRRRSTSPCVSRVQALRWRSGPLMFRWSTPARATAGPLRAFSSPTWFSAVATCTGVAVCSSRRLGQKRPRAT